MDRQAATPCLPIQDPLGISKLCNDDGLRGARCIAWGTSYVPTGCVLGDSGWSDAVIRVTRLETGSFGVQSNLSLTPVLKLEGAQLDKGDLLLRANLSSDRRSLTALTPPSEMPLSSGDHPLQLSLNGQFTGLERRALVSCHPCKVKGPT